MQKIRNHHKSPLTTILLFFAITSYSLSFGQPAKDYRYVICTDMTHDDDNSLIRLLHYANEIDIEAIVVTDQGPETQKIEDWPRKMWARAQAIFDAYEQVVVNLRMHDPNFPSADYFRSITRQGKGTAQRMTGSTDHGQERFWDYVGEDWDSEGSELLLEVFERDDNRPIYVGFWGGSITFAQALWRYKQTHTDDQLQTLLNKLIFHCISFQDVTFDMFLDLDAIGKNIGTSKPFYGDYDQSRLAPSVLLADGNNFWKYIGAVDEQQVHKHSGPLGDLYDEGGEGDTPAYLNLISMNLGLSDIEHPAWGGWGDMFQPSDLKNVWLADHNQPQELMRWLDKTTHSFYARCCWEENPYASCNHAPTASFNGDQTSHFVYLKGEAGQALRLSANGSMDPDGDELSFSWWRYDAADSYTGELTLRDNDKKDASLIVPNMADGEYLHIILEVQDSGTPRLTSYKRIIISN